MIGAKLGRQSLHVKKRNWTSRTSREQIIAALDPVQFYLVELTDMPRSQRKAGWLPGGPCPFHDDRRPNSFRINAQHGGDICHACGAKGDIIAFVMEHKAQDFKSALSWLERRSA